MCLIDVPSLKEIESWEGYFYVVHKFFKSGSKKKEKKNVKKIGQFSFSPLPRFLSIKFYI